MNSESSNENPAISGRLEGISPPDLLWRLGRERRTGVLSVRHGGRLKTFYLEAGQIVFATSEDLDESLGYVLLRSGQITLEQLETAAAELGQGRRLGTVLVEGGALDASALVEGVLNQVHEIVLEWFEWTAGDYDFVDGELPTEELIKLDIDMGRIILQGIRRIQSFQRIRRSVGPRQTVYGLVADWRETHAGAGLSEGEELILVRLEQGEDSIDGLCGEVFLSNFEIYQAMWALKVMGVVEEKTKRFDTDGFTQEGSLENRPFFELLIELAAADANGVLYVQRGAVERTFHLESGRCVFATSNQADDGLMAYLLRRGVISLRDRDEAARRLLTNKRVGTILLEMGVIDAADLTEMVRQQLTGILFDTFSWTDGDYGFRAGELPTIEKITMQESVEKLVAEGLRHIVAWDRICDGIGGLDSVIELTPSYLDRLDALHGGPAEWQVVAALKEPATPRQLCRKIDLPDYRVCQIIWALRVLGAVLCRPAEREIDTPIDIAPSVLVVDVVEQHASKEPESIEIIEVVEIPEVAGVAEEATEQDEIEIEIEIEDEDADRTQILRRDEIEAALRKPPPDDEDDEDERIEIKIESNDAEEPAIINISSEDLIDRHEEQLEPSDLAVASRTVRLDRDEVDRMIALDTVEESVADEPESHPESELSDWQPPDDLDGTIESFIAMQRVVFRAIKAEIGAGSVNLIRACCHGAESELPAVRDAVLRDDGTWDVEALRRAIHDLRIDDPMAEYHALIELEIEQLSVHLGDGKLAELKEQIAELSPAGLGR